MARFIFLTLAFYILPYRFNRCSAYTEQTEDLTPECIFHGLTPLYLSSFFLYRRICIYELIVLFQYTTSGKGEQVFLLYYRDFFEQICSDVQFISPSEEVGKFLLHLLKIFQCSPKNCFYIICRHIFRYLSYCTKGICRTVS